MNKIKIILSLVIFGLVILGCSKQLAQLSNTTSAMSCDSGLHTSCLEPGANSLYSEVFNKRLKEDAFGGGVAKVSKGFFWLGMACSGEYDNAIQIHKYARMKYLIPCPEQYSYNPFEIEYCYYSGLDENGKYYNGYRYGKISRYLPSPTACRYRYYAQNELVDELLERSNDKRAYEYAKKLQKIDTLNDDEFVRMAVLLAPGILRDESVALRELGKSCANIKRFVNVGYKNYSQTCKMYQISKEANRYLCTRYKHTPSCKAIRGIK